MSDSATIDCRNDKRRHEVRKNQQWNGLDYLHVEENQRVLRVYLINKANEALQKVFAPDQEKKQRHVVIAGGKRAAKIVVENVVLQHDQDEARDDYLEITVQEPGDFSNYTLRLAALDNGFHPTPQPVEGIDPRYDRLTFSFKADCPSDLDCAVPHICPNEARPLPEINYLAKDYTSFRKLILDRLSQIMPAWQERHVPDLGVALVELLAYVGDHLSYYQDAVATEAYLDTARQRVSVRRHARLVDYPMHEGCNSRTWVCVRASVDVTLALADTYFIARCDESLAPGKILMKEEIEALLPASRYKVFEPIIAAADEQKRFFRAHNTIAFYTWGNDECCLQRGATSAFLWGVDFEAEPREDRSGNALQLQTGEVLIFEEVIDPQTGNASDANPQHRHAVRLTNVRRLRDELRNQPVVEITWDLADALPFPLCLSAIGPAPQCEILRHVSVARGNVVLADYGRTIENEFLGRVAIASEESMCLREGRLEDATLTPKAFRARLSQGPLTYREPLQSASAATKALQQKVGEAQPEITAHCSCLKPGGMEDLHWQPRRDLLRSEPEDRHFVVEVDNHGRAHLRFGDGENGRQPEAGETFTAHYRIGNGMEGNIGAETIAHVVTRKTKLENISLWPRNPFPAQGGTEPETIAETKLYAPTAFRKRLERAVTNEDYASIAERDPRVQRAAATQRWNGSWYEILLALDPRSQVQDVAQVHEDVAASLQRYRRMGHEVVIAAAQHVALDIRMEVCVLPGYLRGHVKAELLHVFGNKKLADGALGFFHPDNWTFGQAVRLSTLYAMAQKIPGVESLKIDRFQRMFLPEDTALENGVLPIYALEIARLDNDPNFPENGRLELIVKGGR